MVLSRVDETDLLVPLHDGVHETPLWNTFLARLRRRTRADGSAFMIRRPDWGGAQEPDMLRLFAGAPLGFAGMEAGQLNRLRPDRVYDSDDMAGVESALRVVRVNAPGGQATAWAMVARAQEDFSAADSALLSALTPHIGVALRTFDVLERERERRRGAEAALARLSAGWLMLDEDGRVLRADRFAHTRFRDGLGTSRLVGERLPLGGDGARALAGALAAFAADPRAAPVVVPIAAENSFALLAVAPPDGVPGALLGLLRERQGTATRAPVVAQLLGLPASEARLAVALADGASLAETAVTLGITIETARNYSKRIYAKTGVRGQADLVRLILSGIAAFA